MTIQASKPDEISGTPTPGVTIEKDGERVVERAYGNDRVTTVYRVVTEYRDNEQSWSVNAVRIGCPECKDNATALTYEGRYECACGYNQPLNVTTLLLQGTDIGGEWEPY